MSTSGSAAQAQTVANALSGEKGFERIEYAITGDPAADLLSAIRAARNRYQAELGSRGVQRLMEYLAACSRDDAERYERFLDKQSGASAASGLGGLGGLGGLESIQQAQHLWTSSVGGSNYGAQPMAEPNIYQPMGGKLPEVNPSPEAQRSMLSKLLGVMETK